MIVEDFLLRAAIGGIGVAVATGPVGCFVVWRRMAYFGEATAHAAILGVALALAMDIPVFAGVLGVSVAAAIAVSAMSGRTYAMDTLLGVAAHAALALGLVAIALVPGRRVDLESYLFGDILSVTNTDLAVIWIGAAAALGLIVWRWNALLSSTLNDDLASAEGVHPAREQLILTLALAVLVAVALKVVGALLVTAMLIIPSATARVFSRTPEGMAVGAALLGIAAVLLGLALSWRLDSPTGPSIVAVAAAGFILANLARAFRR